MAMIVELPLVAPCNVFGLDKGGQKIWGSHRVPRKGKGLVLCKLGGTKSFMFKYKRGR